MQPPPLLTAHDARGHVHLIVGANPLANARCTRSLEVGALPVVVAPADVHVHYALQHKIEQGLVKRVAQPVHDDHLTTLGRDEVDQVVDAVFVTLGKDHSTSIHLAALCRRLRIPINVSDAPNISTFTLLSTHSDGPLQIGITTSGKGCKLASRIRREVASSLPPNFGAAIERLGAVRRRIWEEDHKLHDLADLEHSDDDAPSQKASFNKLVTEADQAAAKTRRIRWLSQICEYWPLRRLAAITDADVDNLLASYTADAAPKEPGQTISANPHQSPEPRPASRGRIILAGSGPGSPHLLTLATSRAIQTASIILADKLVPAAVMDLIPRRTPVHVARKFPGNAEAAQEELLALGLDALRKGMTVLRLKQGDPYIYGRGGEEYSFFESHGYRPTVLPGITSSLSAPLFAAIPSTHRNVADQVLICTGTGRKGVAPTPPVYNASQTVIFLMALHRLESLVSSLTDADTATQRECWPRNTPCAVLERASCADQRIIRTTLQHVVEAVEEEGSRPPGLLVVGNSCTVLKSPGGAKWVVEEGFDGLDELMDVSGGVLPRLSA